jgi:phage terminase small subunit
MARGGARPGAGRPPKEPTVLAIPGGKDPLEFLLAVMNDESAKPELRVRAAIAAAQYKHTKLADGGKKDERQRAAEAAGSGKFSAGAPPKLVVSNV